MPVKNIILGQKVTKEKLQRAKELRREMTPAEKLLWQEVRAKKLGVRFRRQQIIQGFIVDFYCHKAALVIEVDGNLLPEERFDWRVGLPLFQMEALYGDNKGMVTNPFLGGWMVGKNYRDPLSLFVANTSSQALLKLLFQSTIPFSSHRFLTASPLGSL